MLIKYHTKDIEDRRKENELNLERINDLKKVVDTKTNLLDFFDLKAYCKILPTKEKLSVMSQ